MMIARGIEIHPLVNAFVCVVEVKCVLQKYGNLIAALHLGLSIIINWRDDTEDKMKNKTGLVLELTKHTNKNTAFVAFN